MKFVALLSGGKDSIYAMMESIRHGHELVACVHLAAPHHHRVAVDNKNNDNDNDNDNNNDNRMDEVVEVEESYMYQTAASEVVATIVEECLGVPLIWHRRVGTSINTSLVYQHATTSSTTTVATAEASSSAPNNNNNSIDNINSNNKNNSNKDEVEDLYEALKTAQGRFPGLEAVSSGAILSTYQRVRIEHVCSRLGWTSLSYLWRRAPQQEILHDMIHNQHIHAIVVKTACPPGLQPRTHLQKSIQELELYFSQLQDKYQFHVCGEGGEYETLVLDCPLYQRKLVLDDVQIVESNDGVGTLSIRQWHTEPKQETSLSALSSSESSSLVATAKPPTETCTPPPSSAVTEMTTATAFVPPRVVSYLPHVKRLSGGLLHLSEIMSPVASNVFSEADAAVQEALAVFHLLERTLERYGASPQDVVLVHLYLSEISHFALINTHYRACFGTFLPPSRSCVAVGTRVLPGGRRVLLDCIVQCGSGEYLRAMTATPPSSPADTGDTTTTNNNNNNNTPTVSSAALQQQQRMGYAKAAKLNTTSKLREVLHVQSISQWAPTCVGPYSQANIVRSGLVFLAGQVGLIPSSMKLQSTWQSQLKQSWANVANVLDALQGSSLDHMLSCLIYVGTKVIDEEKGATWNAVESLCYEQIQDNAQVIPGAVESSAATKLASKKFDGYEDEQTMLELTQAQENVETTPDFPLLLVVIPEMPVGALVEVEVIAATQRAASCLSFSHYSSSIPGSVVSEPAEPTNVNWNTGYDDFGVSSSRLGDYPNVTIDITSRFLGVGCAASVILTANSPVDRNYNMSADVLLGGMMVALDQFFHEASGSGLSIRAAWHIRLYYIGTDGETCDDGTRLRSALATQLASRCGTQTPATSVIPVRAMKLSTRKSTNANNNNNDTFLAMHVIVADPVHLETEIWIRHDREAA